MAFKTRSLSHEFFFKRLSQRLICLHPLFLSFLLCQDCLKTFHVEITALVLLDVCYDLSFFQYVDFTVLFNFRFLCFLVLLNSFNELRSFYLRLFLLLLYQACLFTLELVHQWPNLNQGFSYLVDLLLVLAPQEVLHAHISIDFYCSVPVGKSYKFTVLIRVEEVTLCLLRFI